MSQKQQIIIAAYLENKAKKAIARELGVNVKTVRKYIAEYEASRQKLLDAGTIDDIRELTDSIVEKPTYDSKNRSKRKLTDEIIEKIEFYLKENEYKRSIGQSKQQKKKTDIYEALIAEGYDISYPTVVNTVNNLLSKGAEAYIKAEYDPGDVCEFDWGEVKLYIDNEYKVLQLSTFTSAKGNFRYARLFTKQDTACFQESHALFFDKISGVYRTMVYDNTKVAVKKFVGPHEKEPTEALLKLSIYYGFKFRFCNIRSGNEKGHVERSVEYIRRKAFAFKDHFSSIEEANEYLEKVCDQLNNRKQKLNDNKTAFEILEEEREGLLPKMPMYDAARIVEPRVDKYSTIIIDTCHYSVPDMYVGKKIFTKVYSNKILCFYEGVKIAEHNRRYRFNEWDIKIEHYVNTLKRKPGALASSTAMHQADPRLQQIYSRYYIKREKQFIELLELISQKSIEEVEEAISALEKISPLDVTTEKIKAICNRSQDVTLTGSSAEYNAKVCEITAKAEEMLEKFKYLIPTSSEEFTKETVII